MKSVTTLLVVADDGKARFFENRGVGKGLSELSEISAADFEDDSVRYSDRAGRGRSIAGARSDTVARTTSVETQERQAFARHILARANKLVQESGYDRFALVAAPRMLGQLRTGMNDSLSKKLIFDLDKDLIKTPTAKLLDHFADKIAF